MLPYGTPRQISTYWSPTIDANLSLGRLVRKVNESRLHLPHRLVLVELWTRLAEDLAQEAKGLGSEKVEKGGHPVDVIVLLRVGPSGADIAVRQPPGRDCN